mmetsp:Transcript_21479/g.30359  ORF Transcript_21479/g.30359 Transcript_21479/m.30359 type:complete len:539 (+) Transcript_21479:91-1707(+)
MISPRLILLLGFWLPSVCVAWMTSSPVSSGSGSGERTMTTSLSAKPYASISTTSGGDDNKNSSPKPYASIGTSSESTGSTTTMNNNNFDENFISSSTSASVTPMVRPKLLVFDLDNTLWTPELYQIRQRQLPQVNEEIWLFEDARAILRHLLHEKDSIWEDTELAIASRTHKGDWANKLLKQFNIDGTTLEDMIPHKEIYKGSKKEHFANLRESTGIPYHEMVFFDDDATMNLGEVSQLGVLCCHCPRGLTTDLFAASMMKYQSLKQEDEKWMGYVLNGQNLGLPEDKTGVDAGRQTTGRIKYFNSAKKFGFVVEDGGKGKDDYFFHESKVANGLQVESGMRVAFETALDGQGRPSAAILEILDNKSSSKNSGRVSKANTGGNNVEMPCFSMSQPFVSLLLNGIKTVETRNNPMFSDLEPGTKVLLHCGFKDWRDQEAPRQELRKAGFTDEEIEKYSTLPKGVSKGSIVGILTVGETWKSTAYERDDEDLQRKVVATADDMGVYCTEISNPQWLKRSVKARGSPGIYSATVPKSSLSS